jgi:hypothetical protein
MILGLLSQGDDDMSVNDETESQPLASGPDLPSAWAFGAYREGMGGKNAHRRERHACYAIKKELAYVYEGELEINLSNTRFGGSTTHAVKRFQKDNDLTRDGLVGRMTANALWRMRIEELQTIEQVPDNWLRAQVHWESADDPAAEFVNTDGTADRGLCQLNSTRKPLSEDEAFDPATALEFLANHLATWAANTRDCTDGAPSEWHLAVGSWRTPVGARDWCMLGAVEPSNDPTASWAAKAAYYVSRVDRDGRANWVG